MTIAETGRRQFVLRAPFLFQDLLGQRVNISDQRHVQMAHVVVQGEMQRILTGVRGPALRPIEVRVLSQSEFVALYRAVNPDVPADRDFSTFTGFSFSHMRSGSLVWKLAYNMEALRRCSGLGVAESDILVHEVAATMYGHVLEQVLRFKGKMNTPNTPFPLEDISDESKELSMASEGWASLFSHHPFPPNVLLGIENAWLRPAEHAGELGDTARKLLGDRHAFAALALLKCEMAEGFDRLVALMHTPPGLVADAGGVRLQNVIREFWKIYRRANEKLGFPFVPLETITEVLPLTI